MPPTPRPPNLDFGSNMGLLASARGLKRRRAPVGSMWAYGIFAWKWQAVGRATLPAEALVERGKKEGTTLAKFVVGGSVFVRGVPQGSNKRGGH